MFRCEQCQQVVGPNVKSVRVVVQTRVVQHPPRHDAFWVKQPRGRKWVWKRVDDPGGVGTQISRETMLCPSCARRANASTLTG
jgi:hypothetical protein